MLLGVLLDLLEMFIVAVFSEPGNNVPVGPVDLQGMIMLVINVVLQELMSEHKEEIQRQNTNLDRHLIYMYTLLNAKFGNKDIERCVEDAHNLGRANDRSVPLGQIVDKNTKEQMSRLLLSKGGRVALDVALLSNLGHGITIHGKLGLGPSLQG